MSSVAFHSGNKTENTVYLAFGIVVGLAIIRYVSPQSFSDFVVLFGVAAFWGPIIGSLLFFLRLDRIITFSLKEYCKSKYGSDIQSNILTYEFSVFYWLYTMSGNWETPSQKFQSSLNRLIEGTDVHEDIWALKGWFYFLLSIPLLVYAFGITATDLQLALGVIWLIVFFVAFYNYHGFVKRCSFIALFRSLSEIKSIMKTRIKGDSTDPLFVRNEIITATFDELDSMIDKKDWLGFERRLVALLEDITNSLESGPSWFVKHYVETWARCFSIWTGGNSTLWVSRMKTYRMMTRYGLSAELIEPNTNLSLLLEVPDEKLNDEISFFESIDKIGIENASEEYVFQVFYRLAERGEKAPDEGIVRIVLEWYKKGNARFEELLLSMADLVSDDFFSEIITTLLDKFRNPQIWTKIGERSIDFLLKLPEYPERISIVLQNALRDGSKEVRKTILHESNIIDLEIAKQALNLLKSQDHDIVAWAKAFFIKNAVTHEGLREIINLLFSDSEVSTRINLIALNRVFFEENKYVDLHQRCIVGAIDDPSPEVRKEALRLVNDHTRLLSGYEDSVVWFRTIKETDPDLDNRRLAALIVEQLTYT